MQKVVPKNVKTVQDVFKDDIATLPILEDDQDVDVPDVATPVKEGLDKFKTRRKSPRLEVKDASTMTREAVVGSHVAVFHDVDAVKLHKREAEMHCAACTEEYFPQLMTFIC